MHQQRPHARTHNLAGKQSGISTRMCAYMQFGSLYFCPHLLMR